MAVPIRPFCAMFCHERCRYGDVEPAGRTKAGEQSLRDELLTLPGLTEP
jgi:hypothetical protein